VPEQWLEACRGIRSRPRTSDFCHQKALRMPTLLRRVTLHLALLFAVACESGTGPFTGNLRVTAATSGGDLDLNGYTVRVDDVQRATLTPNGVAVISDLATGNHAIALSDVAANCSPSPTNPSAAMVPALAETTTVAFAVACVVTGVRVTTTTTGLDLDANGYIVQMGGTTAPTTVATNGTVDITRLTAGSQSVTLSGLAANCSVSGDNPQSVTLVTGEVLTVAFQLSCVATTGVIEVTAATTGIDQDADGYSVQVGPTSKPLGINGTTRFPDLSGSQSVSLSGLSANCSVAGDNPRTIQVTTGGLTRDTARTTFNVTCVSNHGSLRIATTTTGADFDANGYDVVVDEYCDYDYYYGYYCYSTWEGTVGVNDVVILASIVIGDHTVLVRDVARNCTVASPNPRTVTVPSAGSVDAAFAISCAPVGRISVTVATTGVDPDSNGYGVAVQGQGYNASTTIATNGTATITLLVPGDYTVRLGGASPNCEITSQNPLNATVVGGSTISLSFSVNCVEAKQLAFVSQADGNDEIYLVKSNGTGLKRLTTNTVSDGDPAWSADGLRLAFTSNRDGNAEIYVMNADGLNVARLTNNLVADYQPTWSSDGTKIAFVSERDGRPEIYVMNADGSNQVRLSTVGVPPTPDGDPAWSPDGSKIAFWSTRSGTAEIWVMDADGSNPTKLTSSGENYQPAWSPDGQKLVFRHTSSCYYWCDYDLWVVNISGLGTAKLPTGDLVDTDPHWSPDGAWIAYATASCDYYNCSSAAIAAVRSDGSRTADIVPAPAFSPAWRP